MGTLTYKQLIMQLERETTITLELPLTTEQDKVQARLSQAKHRMGVEGKLSFEWLKVNGQWELTIVLHPSLPMSVVPGSIKKGGL